MNRRTSGVASLHTLLLAAEAVLLWLGLAAAVPLVRSISFTTLLPLPAYPICIVLGVILSMSAAVRAEANFVTPGWADAMRLAFRQTFAVACAVFALAVGMKDPGISRIFLAAYLATTGITFIVLNRFQPGWLLRLMFVGEGRLPTLILGDADRFPELDRWLSTVTKFGFTAVGLVSYRGVTPHIRGLPTVGDFADLKAAITATGARQVLMLCLPESAADAEHIAKICASCGCRLLIHNNLTFQLSYPLRVLTQDGYSFLAFQDEPLEDPLNRAVKRILDVMIALPVVLFLLPLVAMAVWAVQRRQSPGPLLYRQMRSGRGGQAFHILKFRTMRADTGEGDRQIDAVNGRVFSFGHFLRRTSLDELPQFINVLKGHMSVVGPRPHFVRHDAMFADAINEYRVRFFVKPGITGLAQSRGLRGEIRTIDSINQRIQLDLLYIHSWSVWLDLAIIARTARQLIVPPPTAR
jgi:exopolysaccharide biosynthesis polyprenyl glycosylphosphotransferase